MPIPQRILPCVANPTSQSLVRLPPISPISSLTTHTTSPRPTSTPTGGSASSSTDSNPPFADVYIYAVHDRLWLPVPPSSLSQANVEQLTPRLFHSATFVEIEYEPYLVVVGGIFSDRTLAANVPIPTMVNRRT